MIHGIREAILGTHTIRGLFVSGARDGSGLPRPAPRRRFCLTVWRAVAYAELRVRRVDGVADSLLIANISGFTTERAVFFSLYLFSTGTVQDIKR